MYIGVASEGSKYVVLIYDLNTGKLTTKLEGNNPKNPNNSPNNSPNNNPDNNPNNPLIF